MATIYRKTAKGLSEIETRALRLPPRLRSALILIDGRRSDEDMHKLILQQPEETLRTLAEQGFIEIIAITQAQPPARQPIDAGAPRQPVPASLAPTPPLDVPPAATAQSFEATRLQAVRSLTDLVGPMGELLAIKMERSRSIDELRPLMQTAQTVIANSRGGRAAADYAARFLSSARG